ncbi:MAG: YaaA family protein [Desulfobacter sp.]|nr:MAG: YaaA family protein [Desulfobacter sp.]
MQIILSPAKTMAAGPNQGLGPDRWPKDPGLDIPEFDQEARALIQALSPMDTASLKKCFKISDGLALKTKALIQGFENARSGPALFLFQGEAFKSLGPQDFTHEALGFANTHLKIFSGLYGVVSPLDRIKPYRLDFNTPLKINGQGLKIFWKKKLIPWFEALLEPNEPIVNLASDEYSSILNSKELKKRMISFQFREQTEKKLKNIPVQAKQARGYFARYMIQQRITRPGKMKKIAIEGYAYEERLSSENEWFFIR